MTRWFQIKMLPTIKFHNFSRSTKFILVIYLSDIVVVTLFTNLIYLSSTFMILIWEMRYVDFMNNVIVALSNEEMSKINFVDLEKLYNFVVEKFFIWIYLGPQNLLWKNDCRGQKNAHGKMPLCRVPKHRHSAKYSFVEWQKKALGKLRVNCLFEALNEFKSKSGQLQSFINFWVLQFSFSKFFHPRSFEKFEF